jgi:hypothetical protein
MARPLKSSVISRTAKSISVVALLVLLTACGGRTYVDGLPIGERVCSEAPDWLCDGFTDFAASTLDTTAPGHAPVTSVEAYRPDYRGPNGKPVLHNRGTAGGEAIVVFRLADDTVRALYVGCIAGPWGGAVSPPPDAVHCNVMTPMPGES